MERSQYLEPVGVDHVVQLFTAETVLDVCHRDENWFLLCSNLRCCSHWASSLQCLPTLVWSLSSEALCLISVVDKVMSYNCFGEIFIQAKFFSLYFYILLMWKFSPPSGTVWVISAFLLNSETPQSYVS